jgi:formylglycine-generating enzyme required for sulfatase activity
MSHPAEYPQILAQSYADACLKKDATAMAEARQAILAVAQVTAELEALLGAVAQSPVLVGILAEKITPVAPHTAVTGTGNATADHGGTAAVIGSAQTVIFGGKDTRSEQERTLQAYLESLRPLGDMHFFAKLVKKSRTALSGHPQLARVYVGLEVQGTKHVRAISADTKREVMAEMPEDAEKRLPVLSEIVRHRQLVILGEPGSGKSTVGRHLCRAIAAQDEACLADWPAASRPTLPFLVNLRDLARSLPETEEAWPADQADHQRVLLLWRFLEQGWEKGQFTGLRQIVEAALADKKKPAPLFYFDGLDEVRPDLRRRVAQVVRAWGERYTNARILVSCRVRSYLADSPWRLPFPDVTLLPFTLKEQVPQFVQGWFAELESIDWLNRPAAELSQELLQAIDARPELQLLAPSPLLLTMMSLVHGTDKELPSSKAKLYHRLVMLLLWEWEEEKDNGVGLSALFRKIGDSNGSMALLRRVAALVFEQMASWATSGKRRSREDELVLQESGLRAAIMTIHPGGEEERREWAEQVLRIIRQRAALLLPQDDCFTFPHKSLAEFLCALCLCKKWAHQASLQTFSSSLEVWDDWREIGLLAAGHLSSEGEEENLLPRLSHLLPPPKPLKNAAEASPLLIIAAEMLIEIGWPKLQASALGKEQWQRTQAALRQIVQKGWLPPPVRARAGQALSRMGDDRPGVCDFTGIEKADSHFWAARILPGPFPMGNDEAQGGYEDERPRHTCSAITQPFAVSRHLITVAQYDAFVKAGGYQEQRWWTEAGWKWVQEEKITAPPSYGGPYDLPNHPQTGVSWHEAAAFASWLADREKLPIRLPTEAEWERAARHDDARTYPWKGTMKQKPEELANIDATGIGSPSAVGLFPSGKAECGALDLSGNVWEWTASPWSENYSQPAHDKLADGTNAGVLRGGACFSLADCARCALRYRSHPLSRGDFFGFRVVVSPF